MSASVDRRDWVLPSPWISVRVKQSASEGIRLAPAEVGKTSRMSSVWMMTGPRLDELDRAREELVLARELLEAAAAPEELVEARDDDGEPDVEAASDDPHEVAAEAGAEVDEPAHDELRTPPDDDPPSSPLPDGGQAMPSMATARHPP